VVLSLAERQQLAAIAVDRNRPRKRRAGAHRACLGGSALTAAGGAHGSAVAQIFDVKVSGLAA
jgi:hypothetical protein